MDDMIIKIESLKNLTFSALSKIKYISCIVLITNLLNCQKTLETIIFKYCHNIFETSAFK